MTVKKVVFLCLVLGFSVAVNAQDVFEKCCKKQLKQLYQAAMGFVKANDGCLPPAYIAPKLSSKLSTGGGWYDLLAPYLKKMGLKPRAVYIKGKRQPDNTVVHCPANPYWYGGYGPNCVGYIWNRNLGAFGPKTPKSQVKLIKFADIADKDKTILAADSGAGQKTSYNRIASPYMGHSKRYIGFWHGGKANVLFLDGHVELLGPAQITPAMFKIKLK